MRVLLAVLLAPVFSVLFWMWAISAGHLSTAVTFGHGLAVAGVMLAAFLYAATLVILVPLVLVLRGYGFLCFGWVVGLSTFIGMAWHAPFNLYYVGLRRSIELLSTYSGRDFLWGGGAYAFLLASAFCLIAGIPFRRKKRMKDETPA